MLEVNDFNAVRIALASPDQIKSWSYGEVAKPETINYRTLKPEKDGLFCERIFGPTKDWECYCGKYKRIRYKGVICDKCGVEVARAKVRRERMGHIELAAPVSHIWFVKGTPSRVGLLLDISPRSLERVLYFAQFVVTSVDEAVRASALETLTQDVDERIEREEREAGERIEELRTELDERLRSIEQRRDEQIQTLDERQAREIAAVDAEAHELRGQIELLVGKALGDDITFGDAEGEPPWLPAETRITKDTLASLDERAEARRATIRAAIGADTTSARDRADTQTQQARYQAQRETAELQKHIAEIGDRLRNSIDQMRDDLESIKKNQLLTETRFRELNDNFGHVFTAGMGAEAVRGLLAEINLDDLADELRREIRLSSGSGQRRKKATKRLRVVEAFRKSGNRPEWMIMTVLPVLPPDLRPMVQLDGGRFATSDLNDLYRRVINRNNRLRRLLELGAPEIIIRNEKRMLQEAVDSLIDNGRRGRAVSGSSNHKLRSLSDLLKGKQGRFRQNLLGKRVDYSGRSVIVVGPTLKLHQCGLPKRMALELFKPFVMRKLVERGFAYNIKSAKRIVERARPEVWDVLEEVIQDHPVLLNRAPTLHRLGIQAFFPVLIDGSAIQLHPLVCTAFGADFDGDQMAVHVPLSNAAKDEARRLMLSTYNLLSPSSGDPIVSPTLDMVLGCYYMTLPRPGARGEGRIFSDEGEARLAYDLRQIDLQAIIKVRLPNPVTGEQEIMDVTYGRVRFNQVLPDELRYTKFEVMDRKQLRAVVGEVYRKYGVLRTAEVCDALTHLGFDFATRSGITIAITDITIPREKKAELLKQADLRIEEIQRQFRRGLITNEERYNQAIEIWTEIINQVTEGVSKELDRFGGVHMMLNSGAKGNIQQMRQMAGMRGLMTAPNGRIIELPIKSSFREGLSVLEYFISTHGARKGLADTAIRTADSGYLTRRLIDVAQDVIVQEPDCGTTGGVLAVDRTRQTGVPLRDRLIGRISAETVVDSATGEILVERNDQITEAIADAILAAGIDKVLVRSPLTCLAKSGICQKCYGRSLARGHYVEMGEAVGIIAAQSIGEPGTQLTMRTFHTGGIAGLDITSGLPRVEELFEARVPKGQAVIAEIDGTVQVLREGDKREIKVISTETYRDELPLPANPELLVRDGDWVDVDTTLARGESADGPVVVQARLAGRVHIDGGTIAVVYEDRDERAYAIPAAARLRVETDDRVKAGDLVTDGAANPQDILRVLGREAVQLYLVDEVQKVYRSQGVTINDKHIEIIVRQMLRKVRIETQGDTDLLPGELIDRFSYEDINAKVLAEGGEPATAQTVLLGVTKASLNTESFLAAASFQETTRVLTEAAIQGSVDRLSGLKENVIIGKLIPAGSGVAKRKELTDRKRAALAALVHGDAADGGGVATLESADYDALDTIIDPAEMSVEDELGEIDGDVELGEAVVGADDDA
ncbi:MAG: DNA-directed RNA polymerase subunit beta' [Chloroflexota bacterium]|nr:MAG: DNA-directed RNA polymerase subunit beta' [Chloroflexota bacterium]